MDWACCLVKFYYIYKYMLHLDDGRCAASRPRRGPGHEAADHGQASADVHRCGFRADRDVPRRADQPHVRARAGRVRAGHGETGTSRYRRKSSTARSSRSPARSAMSWSRKAWSRRSSSPPTHRRIRRRRAVATRCATGSELDSLILVQESCRWSECSSWACFMLVSGIAAAQSQPMLRERST